MSLAIVTPIYNRAHSFFPTLQSVLDQQNDGILEHIIVSDGSSDVNDLQNLLDLSGSQSFFKLIKLEANVGTGAAINVGVRASSAEWIFTLDSDDVLAPEIISKICKAISENENNFDFFYFAISNSLGDVSPNPKPRNPLNLRSYLSHVNDSISTNNEKGLVARKSIYELIGLPEMYAYEDLFHLELNSNFRGIYINEISKHCDTSGSDRLSNNQNKIRNSKDVEKIKGQLIGFIRVVQLYNIRLLFWSPRYLGHIARKVAARLYSLAVYRVLWRRELLP